MSKVMFDIDDVLYPCVQEIREYLITRGHSRQSLEITNGWDLHEQWGIPFDDLWLKINQGVADGVIFLKGEPFAGTKDAMDELKEDGHTIHLVTARNAGPSGLAEKHTVEWLTHYDLPYDSLTFSSDKTIVHAAYALDDRVENVEALNVNSLAFLMDQPWNQESCEARVYTIQEFVKEVQKWEN